MEGIKESFEDRGGRWGGEDLRILGRVTYKDVQEQQTGSKQEKESVKAVYCYPAYLTSMQSTS